MYPSEGNENYENENYENENENDEEDSTPFSTLYESNNLNSLFLSPNGSPQDQETHKKQSLKLEQDALYEALVKQVFGEENI